MWAKLMMLFILATEYNERGWREAANDGVLTNLTAWEYSGQKKQFSGAIYKTVGGAGAACLMTILIERDEEQAHQIRGIPSVWKYLLFYDGVLF